MIELAVTVETMLHDGDPVLGAAFCRRCTAWHPPLPDAADAIAVRCACAHSLHFGDCPAGGECDELPADDPRGGWCAAIAVERGIVSGWA